MIAQINRDKLNELFVAVYNAFNIKANFCNVRGEPLIRLSEKGRSPLCSYLRQDSFFNQRCVKSDEVNCKRCLETQAGYHFKCHVGMEEFFYPVFVGRTLLGYIVSGQFFTRENQKEVTRNILEVVQPDAEQEQIILRLIEEQQKIDVVKAEAVFKLLKLAIEGIMKDDIIMVQDKRLSDEIYDYIQKNIAEELCTSMICDRFCLSKAKLNRISNDYFGTSIQKCVRNCRIEYGAKLLETSEMSIAQIAEVVGIPDYNYFTKVFRAKLGCVPKEWRKRAKLMGYEDSGKMVVIAREG